MGKWPTNLHCQQYRFKSFVVCCCICGQTARITKTTHNRTLLMSSAHYRLRRSRPAGRPLPCVTFRTKTHMAEIIWFWQQSLGVDSPWLWQHIITRCRRSEDKEKISCLHFPSSVCTVSVWKQTLLLKKNSSFPHMEVLAWDTACDVISNLQLDRWLPCLLLNLYGEIQRVAKIAHFTLRVWTRITYKKAYSRSRVQRQASHPVLHAAALEGHGRLCLCHSAFFSAGSAPLAASCLRHLGVNWFGCGRG